VGKIDYTNIIESARHISSWSHVNWLASKNALA